MLRYSVQREREAITRIVVDDDGNEVGRIVQTWTPGGWVFAHTLTASTFPSLRAAKRDFARVIAASWYRRGERITCPNGHLIGTFRRNLCDDETISPADIDFACEAGERCPRCDALWLDTAAGLRLHVEGRGWV